MGVEFEEPAAGGEQGAGHTNAQLRRYGAALKAFQRGANLLAADSPLRLMSGDKTEVRQALAGDICTETRIRLPPLLRFDSDLTP